MLVKLGFLGEAEGDVAISFFPKPHCEAAAVMQESFIQTLESFPGKP